MRKLWIVLFFMIIMSCCLGRVNNANAKDIWCATENGYQYYVIAERLKKPMIGGELISFVKKVHNGNLLKVQKWTYYADEGDVWVGCDEYTVGSLSKSPLAKKIFYVSRDYLKSDYGKGYGY